MKRRYAWAAGLVGLVVGPARAQAPRPLGAPGETLQQAVQAAEESGRNARMRVSVSAVGFNISPTSEAARDLQAAATAGGGTYVAARDVGQLAGALRQAAGADPVVGATARTVALLPAPVVRGAAENGARLTAALEAELGRGGLSVLPAASVATQIQGANLALPQPLMRLADWGRALGAEYVVYARVLSVGKPFNAKEEDERIMTILVNVVDVKAARMAHAFQVGATYTDKTFPAESVAPPDVTASAAEKLLAAFLTKLPRRP